MAAEQLYTPFGEILNTYPKAEDASAVEGGNDWLPISESLIDYDDDCEVLE